MLVVTIVLLQLREALHPSILMDFIKAPDPDQSLRSAMLLETVSKHALRICGSAVIYFNIAVVMVYVPDSFYRH